MGFLNPAMLLEQLKRAGAITPTPMSPDDLALRDQAASELLNRQQGTASPAAPAASSGMLAPAGVAPGGAGTGIGPTAGPRNPAVISDPNSIQAMQAQILKQLTSPIDVPAPPEPPQVSPAPTMAPLPGGFRGRLVAGLSGLGQIPNPYETQRQQQFKDAMEAWTAQNAPAQTAYQNRLKAFSEHQKAVLEAAQAQRYGAMASSYLAPYFGLSRSGAAQGGTPKVSNVLKFNQGMPVSVTDPQTGQVYPIDPNDKSMSQIPAHLQPLVLAAQRQHGQWYNEQQRLIQTRGEAFRLNTMYPVLDAEDGMSPVMARGYEVLNNPGRYIAGSLGQLALSKENIIMDIGDLSKTVRGDFKNLDRDFTADQRAMMAAALGAPAGQVAQFVESFPRMGMSPAQSKLATDLIQLKENAMALRGIIPGGTTETMRAAIANTLPGAGTPTVPYAMIQLDALDNQIGRLGRGIPKVPMRRTDGGIPTAGEGAPPPPVKGPIASQPGRLSLKERTAPKSPADIQEQIPEYERGPDGKLRLKGQQ